MSMASQIGAEIAYEDNQLKTVFKDGELTKQEDFATIRNRARG
jgi:hypothetical protein